jgi:hypothetical protein
MLGWTASNAAWTCAKRCSLFPTPVGMQRRPGLPTAFRYAVTAFGIAPRSGFGKRQLSGPGMATVPFPGGSGCAFTSRRRSTRLDRASAWAGALGLPRKRNLLPVGPYHRSFPGFCGVLDMMGRPWPMRDYFSCVGVCRMRASSSSRRSNSRIRAGQFRICSAGSCSRLGPYSLPL